MHTHTSISEELRHHVPFTIFGTITGILILFVAQGLPHHTAHQIFNVLHPAHVFLSALATASMYQLHQCKNNGKCNHWTLLLVGYVGSIGVATLSDSVIPYIGERMLGMENAHVHAGFIEQWWLVNPLAIAGVAIAYYKPTTKVPHAGHVLLSTWASLFHMMMVIEGNMTIGLVTGVFVFLFIAVWIPCCLSDIVVPLLFVKKKKEDAHGSE